MAALFPLDDHRWQTLSCTHGGLKKKSRSLNEYFSNKPAGFFIYFGYGIRNSTEASAGSDPDTPGCSIKGEPMTTEKEAFLHDTHIPAPDQEDSWGNGRFCNVFKAQKSLIGLKLQNIVFRWIYCLQKEKKHFWFSKVRDINWEV